MAAKDRKSLHIVMFPWLAFGHIIPFVDFSKLIAQKGHRISFVSTPRNIDRLPKLPPHLASSIDLVKIPLPKIAELPENAEATMDIHGGQMDHLKKAFDGLESGLTRFLENTRPDWILYDFAPHWLPDVAARLGISRAFFMIINAWFLAFFGPAEAMISGSDDRTKPEDFMVPPKWVNFETKVAYRRFDAGWFLRASQKNDSGFSDFYRQGKVVVGSEAILIRHCYEFEPNWLTLLEELNHRPVVPTGLMPPKVQKDEDRDEIWVPIRNWLDTQNKGSVIYVALGREVTISQDQLNELAHGLELSGVPFFWVLRKPSISTESNLMELPDGFEERVSGRGIVWKSWAPQLKILSHESVGGFLTHCGWSSIIEGLMFGHLLITLPFVVDQGLNSRVVAEKQLGIEIPRNEEDGSYTRKSVADSIKLAMFEDDGKKFKEKAKEMSKIFGNTELHSQYINKSIEFLENHKYVNKDI
ncbi:UDP-glucuronosyl and UDP-glucosyl transferase [Handroanthus impetiginosus]|uniref:UDP-glucuronosyl and UDP-glucosyl transferase n=1 Tax=Handroanthus impetiginosus TaxID=429701 RepID=A0A2G9HTA8_9LAMI|nr:UDP-glucuronosyl and UDP-glucosyl transferase [Handroanthus impetiginosus]